MAKYFILALWMAVFLLDMQVMPVVMQETKCRTDAYPPDQKDKVENVVINLDLAPEERWKEITVKMKPELLSLLREIKNFTNFILNGKLFDYVDRLLPDLVPSLPDPYGREIKGIASATGIPLGEVVLYNIFYEVFTVCTSIVAETPEGKLFHARNLDFGLLLGWDVINDTWALSENLRPLAVNFDFQRKGKTEYIVTGFAGFVGAFTGMKPGLITLTMNERFVADGGFIGLLEWILGNRDSRWVTFLARDVLESTVSFEAAKNTLTNTKILAPCYFILGGNSSGQVDLLHLQLQVLLYGGYYFVSTIPMGRRPRGCKRRIPGIVITRGRTKSFYPMSLDVNNGSWYVLQTNYDNWKAPLPIDDRRTPGKQCMEQMTQKNVGFNGIFNVLSTIPVLNKLTTYTALMQVNSGKVISYRRYCRDPCFPW